MTWSHWKWESLNLKRQTAGNLMCKSSAHDETRRNKSRNGSTFTCNNFAYSKLLGTFLSPENPKFFATEVVSFLVGAEITVNADFFWQDIMTSLFKRYIFCQKKERRNPSKKQSHGKKFRSALPLKSLPKASDLQEWSSKNGGWCWVRYGSIWMFPEIVVPPYHQC